MSTRFNPLPWAASALCLALIPCAWMVATEAASALKAIPVSIDALPGKVLPPVLASVDAAVSDADTRVKQVADVADQRTGEVLSVVKQSLTTADARLQSIQDQVDRTSKKTLEVADGVRADLKPVLVNAASLVKDAQESWDDSYWDVKGLLGSATVATTQFAQASETVNKTLPVFLATTQKTNEQIVAIAFNFAQITEGVDHKFFHPPPMTKRQKFFGTMKDLVFVGSRVYGGAK